jgi:hypothetical protein
VVHSAAIQHHIQFQAHSPRRGVVALYALLVCLFAVPAAAQVPISVCVDAVFIADNTEFFSEFRRGETLLGSWQRAYVDIETGERATLRVGAFGIERDGAERRFDIARPVAALLLGTPRHRLTIGTLETDQGRVGIGPDRTTPHGLLPPLAGETQWFTRGYEAGLQWRESTERVAHDLWFNYQRIVTPEHREKFDSGFTGRLQTSGTAPVAFLYQFHVVHHGGQQFENGAVADSFGYGPGVLLRVGTEDVKGSLETYGLLSYDRPDRADRDRDERGKGLFVRGAVEFADWRVHAIGWRADRFKHEDGDLNYLSQLAGGTTYSGRRKYEEAGVAKLIRASPAVSFELSGRVHWLQGKSAYSYRMLGAVHMGVWRRATP